jgi:hypothetical protein
MNRILPVSATVCDKMLACNNQQIANGQSCQRHLGGEFGEIQDGLGGYLVCAIVI